MTTVFDSFALWLADFYLLASVSLAITLAVSGCLKQPVQRLAVVKSTTVALFLLATLCALPGWSLIHLVNRQQPPANGSPANPLHVAIPRDANNRSVPPLLVADELTKTTLAAPVRASESDQRAANPLTDIAFPATMALTHATGSACVFAWLALGALAARRLRHDSHEAPAEVQALLQDLIRQSGTAAPHVDLYSSERIDVAVALGVLRPMVLLPTNWIETLSHDELRTILAHEAAHIASGDLRWLAASRILLVLLWAQPLYWLLRRRMRLDQESLADAAAADLTGRKRYAEQLVTWARNIPARPALHLSAAVGLWERPSQLRQRIALLVDEHFTVCRNCSPLWRRGAALSAILAALSLSLVTVAPRSEAETEVQKTDSIDAAANNNPLGAQGSAILAVPPRDMENTALPVEIPIIVARHVMLHEGKIIEWMDVERLIAALPNPKRAHPSFMFTHGAIPAREEEIRAKIWDLRKRVQFTGHSWGSLSPRTSARYDATRTAADLVPNAAWRVDGMVQTADGLPIDGAQVVLLLPAPESLPYKTLDVYLRNEQLRNADDEIATHSDTGGRFTIYPPPNTPYYLVALHREGFGLVRSDDFAKSPSISIQPWAHVKGHVQSDKRFEQSADVRVTLPADAGSPELWFHQYSVDLGPPSPDGRFELAFVPPSLKGWLSRSVKGVQGSAISLPVKEFQLAPGQTLTVDIELPSDTEAERVEELKSVPSSGG